MTRRKTARGNLPPLKGAEAALHRAAQRARDLARQTGTPLVISEGGKVVRLHVDEPDLTKRTTRHRSHA